MNQPRLILLAGLGDPQKLQEEARELAAREQMACSNLGPPGPVPLDEGQGEFLQRLRDKDGNNHLLVYATDRQAGGLIGLALNALDSGFRVEIRAQGRVSAEQLLQKQENLEDERFRLGQQRRKQLRQLFSLNRPS